MIEVMSNAQLPPPQIPHITQQSVTGKKTLAIAALAVGLVALLTLIVSVFYAAAGLIVSAFFGVVACGLAVAALITKHRPLGATIAGLTSGVVSVILSIVVMVASMLPNLLQPLTGTGSHDEATVFETPQHMGTGGVVFGSEMQLVPGDAMDPKQGPTARDTALAAPVDIIVYVDYRCPHCLAFEQLNGATLQRATASGRATVEIRPLTFMDRISQGTAYSSRAAAMLACTVDTQPGDAWRVHSLLLSGEVQPQGEGPGLTNDELLSLAEIVMPVSPELRDCVTEGRFLTFVSVVNEWTFAHPALGAADSQFMITGTPQVLIAGEPYTGDLLDAAAFAKHLTDLGLIE